MMIHKDQQNVRQLCELADFIDSGHQSFRDQVKALPAKKISEAAFFAGAALAMKLMEHFKSSDYSPEEIEFLKGLICMEVNDYMARNHIALEWEPHVPSAWKQ